MALSSYFNPYSTSVILPAQWKGEANCLIGPFSSKPIAECFLNAVIDFNHYDVFSNKVFAKLDSWYVEIAEA